jgi:hypothetical protein
MKNSVNLPLYNEFLELFDNYKILNWKAENFWEVIKRNQPNPTRKYKRQMYEGLKVLLECQYLEIDTIRSRKKAFIYSETPRLEELRSRHKNEQLAKIFSCKKASLLNDIEELESNITFINNLVSEDQTLEKYFIEIKELLEKDIRKFKSNIKLMDGILGK